MVVGGYSFEVRGVNVNGLIRWGYSQEQIQRLRHAYKVLYGRKPDGPASLAERICLLESDGQADENVRYLLDFLKRSLRHGVYGRYRESLRHDTAEDRQRFYREADAPDQAPSPEVQ